ncbi:MAG: glycoside hydrolase family 78 protein [Prolixibacteraceae bacterium]|nr:glycoside hydrolase family 78 protein [Prolixibacteraceae bacterium]
MKISIVVLAFFFAFCGDLSCKNRNLESLQIRVFVCEQSESPLGNGDRTVRFSWVVTSAFRGAVQHAYRIEAASTAKKVGSGTADFWCSDKIISDQTMNIPYQGKMPKNGQSLFCRITVWDNEGDSVLSTIREFRCLSMKSGDWKAKWIGADAVHDPLPAKGFFSGAKEEGKLGDSVAHNGRSVLLRHDFQLKGKIRAARVFVTGLGLYELFINGERVGDQQLSPAKTPYHKQILFDSFDVKSLLVEGRNAIGIHLGNGWYNPYKKWWQEYRMQWFGSKKALLQLEVEYLNGNKETIVTDGNWKCSLGPSLYNCIYDGEIYDATQEYAGWTEATFDDHSWKPANVVETPQGKLTPCDFPSIKIVDRLKPKRILQPKPGTKIYDFGQNFAGWTSVTLKGKRGTKIKIRYSEELDAAGNLDVTCNEYAKATAEYTLKGGGIEIYQPHFTFFGFQYAEITSETTLPEIVKVEGCVVHSDNKPAGTFSCNNPLVNRIHHATLWSQKSNMIGYPMDCPQRDERLGWMGDAQVTAEEALYNFDMGGFYRNWFRGIRENQDAATGDIPIISPRPYIRDDGVEWSSTYLTMVWDCYRYYGDKQLIGDHYDAMARYFAFLESRAKGVILPKGWIGDWGSRAKNWKEGDPESVPTAYYYLDAKLLSKMAGVQGKKKDSIYYAGRAEKIREGYNASYFHPDQNSYNDGSQMANAFPLYLGLVPENKNVSVLSNLVNQIVVNDSSHLTTGVLGTKYLPKVLSGYGKEDIVWTLVNQTGYPSWSEMMKKYNTMCEFWTLKQSHNHVLMGSIDSWFYETLAGVKLSEEFPAYKKTIIHPYFAKGLNRVDCSLETVRGRVSSCWVREGSTLKLNIEIPFNCESEVWIPNEHQSSIMESGKAIASKKEITLLRKEGDFNVYRTGSGSYHFEVRLPAGKF